MSNAVAQLKEELPGTRLPGAGLQVRWEREPDEIWIATQSATEPGDSNKRFVCLEGAPKGPRSALGSFNSAMGPAPVHTGARLYLNISTKLLESVGMFQQPDPFDTNVITDAIVFELARGVVEAHTLTRTHEYTRCHMVKMLCIQLLEATSAPPTVPQRRSVGFEDWQLRSLETALQELGSMEISLGRFAERCGLSVCHFARLFKLKYGMPFHRYVVQLKLMRARTLLTETHVAVSQIALECGFSDQSSFTRSFSANTGTSPAAWRKALSIPARGNSLVSDCIGWELKRFAVVGRC